MIVAGVDFDTKFLYVTRIEGRAAVVPKATLPDLEVGYDILRQDWIKFSGSTTSSFDRLRRVAGDIPVDLWDGIDVVGIEDPRATNPLLRSMIGKLARVQGAIVSTIPLGVRVEPLNATEWRSAIGLKGNAKKDEVYEWAVTHGWDLHDGRTAPQDFADAYAILRAAEGLANGEWKRKPKARKKTPTVEEGS